MKNIVTVTVDDETYRLACEKGRKERYISFCPLAVVPEQIGKWQRIVTAKFDAYNAFSTIL